MKTNSRTPRPASSTFALIAQPHSGALRNAFLLAAVCALPCVALAASHGKKKGTQQQKAAPRIVAEGKVISHTKAPVNNAVVYLENPNTQAIRSYLTDVNGNFHFTQLAPQTDYEIWAEQNGVESKHKFISQFSSHTDFKFTLQLNPGHHKFLGFL